MSQATLDHPVTDKELNQFYGTDKGHEIHDLIQDTITKTVRTVSHRALSLPYVQYLDFSGRHVVKTNTLQEIFADSVCYPKAIDALMVAIEKSDCPHVAAFRKAVADLYADQWADEVDEALK
jgi:hypothetical protein